ncbi:MAG: precorrin-6y C5,15-methyltransferase (decarboxylating) subunit CbiE [Rhodospirillaceae bacterium]|jgi:precorrin-6B C5,15-methyltransferase / cobalt-precorrin-6B C5,C15-methyltransferase|nr:precorrin-6y C5,15-methyltransferase (decarboxylating) subunit CbiE [Rhodospirillaceae bacterium]MBT5563346.1 precorrin-6y C5,15-methyltransferase (decarboxylating) subunit CbiE [Rhodospirillaceae bacterium]MBT6243660.1 precorrin-6y C5,15-methyltransferase (decarboxylating) subunit CbiE [Rhodospirillaceae bacterium]MBT7136408.1 precorrin-6y C5,15-methyltransferase (decarboxylating) subunit CbiE [Rhodospirillaceae bacterium]
MSPWITVIGIGEDGLEGLSAARLDQINAADVLIGGARHHGKVDNPEAELLDWGKGFDTALKEIEKRKGKNIVVLGSGDPMNYGIGAVLVRHFGTDAVIIHPAPGAFSLAAARMGWSIPDTETLTIHGRPLETLNRYVMPGARLLVLTQDGDTPAKVARLLTEKGYGESRITVLEHLGGSKENKLEGTAATWNFERAADLNTLAIDCIAGIDAPALSRTPGLPDEVFENDGQLTKREVRAATLAQLQPLPGQVLWDIGAGSGSISIEWLRLGGHRRAIAIERNPERVAAIKRNADTLGTPDLIVVEGDFDVVKGDLKYQPDAIFVGGGASSPQLLKAAWTALNRGGRFVVNAVSIEAEQALLAFRAEFGGDLSRLSIERAGPIGSLSVFRPLITVTQLVHRKST